MTAPLPTVWQRDAVFARTDLLAAALAFSPGSASIGAIERAVDGLKRGGRLHEAPALKGARMGRRPAFRGADVRTVRGPFAV